MIFNPNIHTKDFLTENIDALFNLAETSKEFAKSNLSIDPEILKLKNRIGVAVIHTLAKHQRDWLSHIGVIDLELLEIKDYMGWSTAHYLASFNPHWLSHESSKNKRILSLKTGTGLSVAHILAEKDEWLSSQEVNDLEILKLCDNINESVAHILAQRHVKWIGSEASCNKEILMLSDVWGWTVAHVLADSVEWFSSKAAQDLDILKLQNSAGLSVAFSILTNPECLKHPKIMDKEILTLLRNSIPSKKNEIFAESLLNKFGKTHQIDLIKIATTLIKQGAAYVHSKPISFESMQSIFVEIRPLIVDCLEPHVALRYAQALYSTQYHNLIRISQLPSPRGLERHQALLNNMENLISDTIKINPSVIDKEIVTDFFCEPSKDIVHREISKAMLQKTANMSNLMLHIEDENKSTNSVNQLTY